VLATIGIFVGIARQWNSSEFGQTPAIAHTAIDKTGSARRFVKSINSKQRDWILGDSEARRAPLHLNILPGDSKEIGTSTWVMMAVNLPLRQITLR
jgi:hypothetical protein